MKDLNPYLLLTPGPLSTTPSVKETMLRDWCTWDEDYNLGVVQPIRQQLVELAVQDVARQPDYTAVLMQGSGTFSVESCIGSAIPTNGKLLVLKNGAYGDRIQQIAEYLNIETLVLSAEETNFPSPAALQDMLISHPSITHVACVHCETTTGILNPIEEYAPIIREAGKTWIVDAMSSFGGTTIDMAELGIHFLISSANKCIQGVPGFGFVIANKNVLNQCEGQARSLSLDLFDQWQTMEQGQGKWRFTSPTHVVRAFQKALEELKAEGGISKRSERYLENHRRLILGMDKLGFTPVIDAEKQSPFITTFLTPESEAFNFLEFYTRLKSEGFVIYPGKVSDISCFRIGHIGEVYPMDIDRLLMAIEKHMYWKNA